MDIIKIIMIIWIASYPKSGNTWLRSIIGSLLYSNDGIFNFQLIKNIKQFPSRSTLKDFTQNFNDINELSKYWILAQEKINLANGNLSNVSKKCLAIKNFTVLFPDVSSEVEQSIFLQTPA